MLRDLQHVGRRKTSCHGISQPQKQGPFGRLQQRLARTVIDGNAPATQLRCYPCGNFTIGGNQCRALSGLFEPLPNMDGNDFCFLRAIVGFDQAYMRQFFPVGRKFTPMRASFGKAENIGDAVGHCGRCTG